MAKHFIRGFSLLVFAIVLTYPVTASTTYEYSDVFYLPESNTIVGYFYLEQGYDESVFYCMYANAPLNQIGADGVPITIAGSSPSTCDQLHLWAWNEVPYDPNLQYEAPAETHLQPVFRNEFQQWWDYYNYQSFSEGMPVYAPLEFYFEANGPSLPSLPEITLGIVSSFWTDGGKAGLPHHLKVLDDHTTDFTSSCTRKRRLIQYQVVDQSGRPVGTTTIGETFPGDLVDTCNGTHPQPSPCYVFQNGHANSNHTDSKGRFTDELRVGCPAPTNDCGIDATGNKWVWCQRGTSGEPIRTTLATVDYILKKSRITVNSSENSWEGHSFFADGTVQ